MSDRASKNEYEDRSGPRIKILLENFFRNKRWHIQIENLLLPDDSDSLREELIRLRNESVDIIFTTGGTGIGPRDITPDTVAPLCDKVIPGIMEYIRIKYGQDRPNALLSRSIAGVMRNTLIYTLPGSIKAVEQYLEEILKTLEHLILTINNIDNH